MIHRVTPDQIQGALERAHPGDVVEWEGKWIPARRRILNIRGKENESITLQGSSPEKATVLGDRKSPYAVHFEDCPWFRFGSATVKQCWGDEARGVQAFRCDSIGIFDLITQEIALDHIHLAGCSNYLVERCKGDGEGGKAGRHGTIGFHFFYATTLDRDCKGGIARDLYCKNMLGAYQANGDEHWLFNPQFIRVMSEKHNGPGINLARCRGTVQLEDIILKSKQSSAGGIRAYDGTEKVIVNRYLIDVPQGNVDEDDVLQMFEGEPAEPKFEA